MAGPVSENGTPWNQLPGATGGLRTRMTPRPKQSTPLDLFSSIVKAIVRAIMGGFTPGGTDVPGMPAGANPLAFLSDLMGQRWDQLDEVADGQLDLNDRTDLLSPLLDYGSAYASTASDITNTGQYAYDYQIGPMRSCYIWHGRIILLDKGLWDIRARIFISFTVSPIGHDVGWEVRVLRPDGSIFSSTEDVFTSPSSQTREINTSVVVPDAFYQVQVFVKTLLVGRGINGGPNRSRLTVQHISRDTSNPI